MRLRIDEEFADQASQGGAMDYGSLRLPHLRSF